MKVKLMTLIIMLLTSSLALAIDPWGEPVILTGSMTVMAQVSISGTPAASGDVLGAFVSVGGVAQLRGKATVMINGGIAGCLIQIYTETNGETISFKVWDDSASIAYEATQTLPSEVNGIVGSYPDNMYQITAGQTQVTDPWPEPAILTGSMTVMAQVSIGGSPATNEDILAAFVTVGGQEQLRGKGPVMVNSGIAGCLLQIYTETNGEQISFKVWDYSAQDILTVNQTLPSEVNGIVGSWPDNLYQIYAGGGVQQVATPSFNPAAGIYQTAQSVTIFCSTTGATIRYTTDGSDPTETSTIYTTPIALALDSSTTIKARGFLSGWTPSAVATASYIITGSVATPAFNPAAGTYATAQNVVITCATAGATIRYTTDGSEPTATSTIYTTPIVCPLNSATTIKAKGFKTDWTPSATATAQYIITGSVATPSFNPAAGTYSTAQNVVITCATAGATIRYTTDGSEPTATSTIYTTPIVCPLNSSTTIKAKGFKTDWTPSPTVTSIYVITGTVATPSFDPPAGEYDEPIEVQISCATPGAEIRFTTDGSEPTATSLLYTAPIPVDQDTTIKAKAFKTDWTPSPSVTAIYVIAVAIDDDTAVPAFTGIHHVYPNPFVSTTTIRLGFKDANASYSLKIYNLRGEVVFQTNGHASGYTNLKWNGCDNSGNRLASGIYFISLRSYGTNQTRKIVLK